MNLPKAFVALARCSVEYDGRALSKLTTGNYLIIRKIDGTLLIHGATSLKSLNHQSPGGNIQLDGQTIISKCKKELIIIRIETILNIIDTSILSDGKPIITKTEIELRNHISKNLSTYIRKDVKEYYIEYQTEHGPIDIFAIDIDDINHIIEVKRGLALQSACRQLDSYIACIKGHSCGWIMSPTISKNALKYLLERHYQWVQVEHSVLTQKALDEVV
jgi:hypothetical protein